MKSNNGDRKKTVFISGAGGGLGKVLVIGFAGKGYHVIATDIDAVKLEAFHDLQGVITRELDVTDPEALKNIVEQLEIQHKGLDILVSQAGIYNSFPITEADPAMFRKIMDVNLLGTASLVQGLLTPLVKNKGRVIVVSSESYKIQALFQPYMISKAALEAYCLTARQELALKGVKLSVIRPGAMQTPLLNWMNEHGQPGRYPIFEDAFNKSIAQSKKMVGKIVSPEKVAQIIFKAATSNRPKRIYTVNNSFLLRMISLIPKSLIEKIVISKFSGK
jgi:NAD(P)-dependent dehydrogenase (short-subunit alcohol dehydrogenase family)